MNFSSLSKYIIILTLCFHVFTVAAQVKLPAVFSDGMVLQTGKPVKIWGTAAAKEKITVNFGKQKKQTTANDKGAWQVTLNPLAVASTPTDLLVKGSNSIVIKNVLVGEVWICSGQSNMDMTVAKEDRYWCGVINEATEVAAANYPLIRVFDTDFTPSATAKDDVTGKWETVSPQTVGHLSAAAYFFARDVQKKLNVPIGLITTAYGASTAEAWIREEALLNVPVCKPLVDSFKNKLNKYLADTAAQNKYIAAEAKWKIQTDSAKVTGKTAPKAPRNPDPVRDQHNASVLWNGMVKGLVPYTLRGALWYQGESNSPTAKIYRTIMETLIKDWRSQWAQGDFPFIYVQLANIGKTYDSLPAKGGSEAIKREAQLQNLSLPNTAMVVAIDNADANDMNNVHPKNKQEIGRRLALAALNIAYQQKNVYSGPLYDKMEIQGNAIKLYFKNTGSGLVAKEGELKGFAIAGEDKKFVWGNAKIEGNAVIVTADGIDKPAAVRYGWSNNPVTSLYNKEELPASPFRTDAFDK
ncbi:sialate O-acetylesterase [Ferruginibacter sp.]